MVTTGTDIKTGYNNKIKGHRSLALLLSPTCAYCNIGNGYGDEVKRYDPHIPFMKHDER